MENKLILLNGAINSGKSTVGRLLLERCGNLAFIDVDDLHGFIPWMDIVRAVPLNLRNAVDVARNFTAEGIDVVMAYPLSDQDYIYVRKLIDFTCDVIGVTLYCAPEENAKNRGTRELNGWEVERVRWMHENGLAKPGFSRMVIDTAKYTPVQVADMIVENTGLTLTTAGR